MIVDYSIEGSSAKDIPIDLRCGFFLSCLSCCLTLFAYFFKRLSGWLQNAKFGPFFIFHRPFFRLVLRLGHVDRSLVGLDSTISLVQFTGYAPVRPSNHIPIKNE